MDADWGGGDAELGTGVGRAGVYSGLKTKGEVRPEEVKHWKLKIEK